MSSKVKTIGKEIAAAQEQEKVKTKDLAVRIDVKLGESEDIKSTYMLITGVPEDLPQEFEDTVLRTAEGQFSQALNQRDYIEFYPEGKTAKDCQPKFINIKHLSSIEIVNVQKVE